MMLFDDNQTNWLAVSIFTCDYQNYLLKNNCYVTLWFCYKNFDWIIIKTVEVIIFNNILNFISTKIFIYFLFTLGYSCIIEYRS